MTPVLGRIQKLRHVFNAQLIFLDTSIPNFPLILKPIFLPFKMVLLSTGLTTDVRSYQYNLNSYQVSWTPVISLNAFSSPSRLVYKQLM